MRKLYVYALLLGLVWVSASLAASANMAPFDPNDPRFKHDREKAPDGYIGYAPDGRMYAIFTRDDRVAPRDVVPTDEEGVQLLGTMVAYAGTFSLGENVVVHHIDTSWNQAWTGTNQIRHFVLEGDTLTITTAPYKSYLDGTMGRSILVWDKVS